MFEWDERKSSANLAKHGVDFDAIFEFDWLTSVEVEDDRFDYGEDRLVAIGWLRGDLYTVTFTWRGDIMRIISLRKSDKRDRTFFANAQKEA